MNSRQCTAPAQAPHKGAHTAGDRPRPGAAPHPRTIPKLQSPQENHMAATPSTMLPLGTPIPNFSLPDTRHGHAGSLLSPQSFDKPPALLIMFICNHCPFVKHIQQELVRLARDYTPRGGGGVGIIAI